MRILVAGASGAVGKALLPVLVQRGHNVGGLVRNPRSAEVVLNLGGQPLIADALDIEAVNKAFDSFRPDAVVHQLTALSAGADISKFDEVFAATNILRTRGTDNLLQAARRCGVRRFVTQSFGGWPYARVGSWVKSESDPLDPNPLPAFAATLKAIRYNESAVTSAGDVGGVALRYGAFYGPATFLAKDGSVVQQVRKRLLPLIGSGRGVWSFIHVTDVASATAAVIEAEATGIFNVVDDDPAPVSEWLPYLASAVGAKRPYRIPTLLARLVLPAHLIVMMTEVRGCSNDLIKSTFDWRPKYASWRHGFVNGL